MRPGTAPKNSMMNNISDMNMNYNSANNTMKYKKQGERPLSPYTKVYHQAVPQG